MNYYVVRKSVLKQVTGLVRLNYISNNMLPFSWCDSPAFAYDVCVAVSVALQAVSVTWIVPG